MESVLIQFMSCAKEYELEQLDMVGKYSEKMRQMHDGDNSLRCLLILRSLQSFKRLDFTAK